MMPAKSGRSEYGSRSAAPQDPSAPAHELRESDVQRQMGLCLPSVNILTLRMVSRRSLPYSCSCGIRWPQYSLDATLPMRYKRSYDSFFRSAAP
jgi:hypothetical protein